VLSFGGPPSFQPSAWEWAFRAAALRRDDPAAARVILEEGLTVHPDSPTIYYELACIAALDGRPDEALGALGKAVELSPEIKDWARDDADFVGLRGEDRFRELVES
jgi:tetratricopeptide (TPR) repeat protein